MFEEMKNNTSGRDLNVRYFAHKFGVNQPSVLKSINEWIGIHRNDKVKLVIDRDTKIPVNIEGYTEKIEITD